MNTRYSQYGPYCHADRLFYDRLPKSTNHQDADLELEANWGPVASGWSRGESQGWVMYRRQSAVLPAQGWKIHVSACLSNAVEILTATGAYCLSRELCFKFLATRHRLHVRNSKEADRGSSGKFITIYPVDEAQLEVVLKDLDEILDGQPGPYILSDLRWGAGPLYVRYGAFSNLRAVFERGEEEPAIEDPAGRPVPDRREPAFSVPTWVTLPAFLAPHLAARTAARVGDMDYHIERALHFSNGGGLYQGRRKDSGERVVLKEARAHAGIDAHGNDAVSRLRRERTMLHRLAGLNIAPILYDYFIFGEHHFLVQEFVDGESLNKLFTRRYPLTRHSVDRAELVDYTSWALEMIDAVERAVAALHKRGVVFGDLHPSNVIVRPDGRVLLIDFESAASVEGAHGQAMANPSFQAPKGHSGFDIDRYALACLRLYLFLPLTGLFHLDAHKAEYLAREITNHFPVPSTFLTDAVEVLSRRQPNADTVSRFTLSERMLQGGISDWAYLRQSLAHAILASATPERDDRLFPGDIEQFTSGGLSLAYGAAGVLYALSVTGAGRSADHEKWLIRHLRQDRSRQRIGFYDGLHGIAYALNHLGYHDDALDVLLRCLAPDWERLGSDLYSGLAGIGLNLAHFAGITEDAALHEAAYRVVHLLADRLAATKNIPTISGGANPRAGLLHGWAGPALLFLRWYEITRDPAWLDLAATALRHDLRRCITSDDGSVQVNEGWRRLPYLATGSVGIGCVVHEYLTHRPDEQFTSVLAGIDLAARSPFYIQAGLFSGRASMIFYQARRETSARKAAVISHLPPLSWHALPYCEGLAFPGETNLRLSMDLGTGTAGVLLALGAALHHDPVSLPFLTRSPASPSSPKTMGLTPSRKEK